MKSVERHKLETNVLAHGLEVYIERYRPYFSKIAWGVLAAIALIFAWSFVSGSSASRQDGAWDAYNEAIGTMNLDQLRQTAEANPGTKMEQLANLTWADGQVMNASNVYIYNRNAAKEALTKAASAYQSVIQSSSTDPRLAGRAHLGLARAYEMQNELEKAREQYGLVTGPYAKYAKAQAERLATPDAQEIYAWLATAQPPRPVQPAGPGTPGKGPEFSPGDINLPQATSPGPPAGAGEGKSASETFDALLKEMQKDAKPSDKDAERYKPGAPPATDSSPAAPGETKSSETPPSTDGATPPPASPAAPSNEKTSK